MSEQSAASEPSQDDDRVPSRAILRALSHLQSFLLTVTLILAIVSAIALMLALSPALVFNRIIYVSVALFVMIIAYGLGRRRIVLLTDNLRQRILEELARLGHAIQATEMQCREQRLAAVMARDLAECVQRNAPCPVLVADAAGLLVSANPAAQSLLGADIVQAGEPVTDWAVRHSLQYSSGQPVPPGAIPLTQAIRDNKVTEREEFLLFGGQSPQIVELTSAPMVSDDGNHSVGAVAFLNDVTELRRSRQQEALVRARIAVLASLSRRLALASSLEEIYRSVTEGALALLPPEMMNARASLYGFEDDVKRLFLLAEAPDRRPRRPRPRQQAQPPFWPFNARSPLLWQLYVSRQPVVCADITEDKQFDDEATRPLLSLPEDMRSKSLLAVPIVMGKQVGGHLILTSDKADALGDEALQEALASVAALAAIAQSQALLNAQASQQACELAALGVVAQAAAVCKDARELADTLTEQVRAVFSAEVCTLSVWEAANDGERRLRCLGKKHEDALLPGQTMSLSPLGCADCDHLTEEVAARNASVSRSGIPNPSFGECRWRAFTGQSGTHSVLASPLRQGGEVLGALTVYRSGDTPFTPPQIQLLETFSALVAAAVQRVESHCRVSV